MVASISLILIFFVGPGHCDVRLVFYFLKFSVEKEDQVLTIDLDVSLGYLTALASLRDIIQL